MLVEQAQNMLVDLFLPYSLNKFTFSLLVPVEDCPQNKLVGNLFFIIYSFNLTDFSVSNW